jgi:hypothetical protein
MKKLYKVCLEYEVMVLAEDEYRAMSVAKDHVAEEEPMYEMADEVDSVDLVCQSWLDSYPYGAPTTATVSQIIGDKDAESRES